MPRIANGLSCRGYFRCLVTPVYITMIFAVALFDGCGKKGPPKPPRYIPPPVVTNLVWTVKGDAVQLTWTLPSGAGLPEDSKPAGCIVYRSKTPLSEAGCQDCPLEFEKAVEIPVTAAGTATATWGEPVQKGYRYIYKVNVYTVGDDIGGDSNRAEFIH